MKAVDPTQFLMEDDCSASHGSHCDERRAVTGILDAKLLVKHFNLGTLVVMTYGKGRADFSGTTAIDFSCDDTGAVSEGADGLVCGVLVVIRIVEKMTPAIPIQSRGLALNCPVDLINVYKAVMVTAPPKTTGITA